MKWKNVKKNWKTRKKKLKSFRFHHWLIIKFNEFTDMCVHKFHAFERHISISVCFIRQNICKESESSGSFLTSFLLRCKLRIVRATVRYRNHEISIVYSLFMNLIDQLSTRFLFHLSRLLSSSQIPFIAQKTFHWLSDVTWKRFKVRDSRSFVQFN